MPVEGEEQEFFPRRGGGAGIFPRSRGKSRIFFPSEERSNNFPPLAGGIEGGGAKFLLPFLFISALSILSIC
jgi:hypothetical protein